MKAALAILLSLAFHGAVALAIVLILEGVAAPKTIVTLDLSSVELSFSEQERESAEATLLSAPCPAPPSQPPAPPAEPPPPALIDPTSPLPRETPEILAKPPEPPREKMPEETLPKPPSPPEAAPVPVRPAPRQAKIDAPPKPRRTIRPEYPKSARQRGEEGSVTCEIRVGADGRVTEAICLASSGYADLDAAALKAVREARFTPAKADGRSVAATARITLEFKLK